MKLSDWLPFILLGITLSIGGFIAYWKGWNSLIIKINSVGEKYNLLETKVVTNETKIDAIKEELATERLAVMTLMFNNEKAANERHADLKVQLATLQERINVADIVRTTVREMQREQ